MRKSNNPYKSEAENTRYQSPFIKNICFDDFCEIFLSVANFGRKKGAPIPKNPEREEFRGCVNAINCDAMRGLELKCHVRHTSSDI